MSGRGRGRSSYTRNSGGRSQTRSRNNGKSSSQQSNNNNKEKSFSELKFYIGSAKQASDFETTRLFLINHIKKTFKHGNDIATALEKEEPYNINIHLPRLTKIKFRTSTSRSSDVLGNALLEDEPGDDQEPPREKNDSESSSGTRSARRSRNENIEYVDEADYDPDDLELINEEMKMQLKDLFNGYMKRKNNYEENLDKAYAFLWERCTKAMQNKIESDAEYSSKIQDNPIELIKSIKKYALSYQDQKYEMASVFDALKVFVSIKQEPDEDLQDYTRRFKSGKDVMVSLFGGIIPIERYVKTMEKYDETDAEGIKECRQGSICKMDGIYLFGQQ